MRVDSAKIRQLRRDNRYTLDQMANLMGYKHASSYQRAETGLRQFKPEHIAIIAAHFSVPMESLFLADDEVTDTVTVGR